VRPLACAILFVLGACSSSSGAPDARADAGPNDGPAPIDHAPTADRPRADAPTDLAPPAPDAAVPDSCRC
jgi:hypothetical protein